MLKPYRKPLFKDKEIRSFVKTVQDNNASVGCLRSLTAGFRRGMVSQQIRRGWPRNVWAVDEDGVVYEAQLSNAETGEYHGYPMKRDDGFTAFIAAEWERREA